MKSSPPCAVPQAPWTLDGIMAKTEETQMAGSGLIKIEVCLSNKCAKMSLSRMSEIRKNGGKNIQRYEQLTKDFS